MNTKVNVLYMPGINCQSETMKVFRHVGAHPRLVFISDVLAGKDRFDDADVLCIPGGFSYGDHVRGGLVAGRILANAAPDQLEACTTRPMICICNGFQIGIQAGLFGRGVTLGVNSSGVFLNRPEQKHVVSKDAVTPWLRGLEGQTLTFPCAHGEGRFLYSDPEGWLPAIHYPDGENPDGSQENVAGIVSSNRFILGLMDHPERASFRDENLTIFENGVRWL